MIEAELRDGRLLAITGKHFAGGRGEIVAARRRNKPHGPVANRLWRYIAEEAPTLAAAETGQPARRKAARTSATES